MPMTEEELELLTQEERAGLEEDDTEGEEEGAEGGQADGDDGKGDEDQDDQGEGDDEEDQSGDDEGNADDDQEDGGDADDGQPGRDDGADTDDQKGDGEDEENPDRPVAPEFTLQAPEGVDDKRKAFDAREDELNEKFDDGDISAADFRKAIREINQEREDLTWSVRKYEQAKERHDESVESAKSQWIGNWYGAAKDFIEAHPELSRNATVMQVFDNLVQQVNTEENINKFSHQKRLDMAYKQWAEDLGFEPKAPNKKDKPGKKAAPPKKRELPPSLGNLPSADVNETDNGTHGTLNRLFNSSNPNDVARAEDMLSKMSEADQDRYLRSN